MSSFFGISSTDGTNFFNSYFGTSSSSPLSSGSLSLSDYSMIQSGAYKKLLKKYYAENDTSSTSTSSTDNKTFTQNLVTTKSAAEGLKDSAAEVKEADFSTEKRADAYNKVKGFVEDYNETMSSLANLDQNAIVQNGVWMKNQTSKNEKLLKDIGITVGTDNKLSLDETTFTKAVQTDIETLFTGNNSFASMVGKYASNIYNLSAAQAFTSANGSTYGSTGNYQVVSSSALYDSLL